MTDKAQEQNGIPGWLKTGVFFAACGIAGYFISYRAAERRLEPQIRAMEQLSRDLQAIKSMPMHRRAAELFEALNRANNASPELAEAFLASDDHNIQFYGHMLQLVRTQPKLTDPTFQDQLSKVLERDPEFLNRKMAESFR